MALGKYIKAAFANRWNLLLFVGGMAAAAISGQADVVAPLVMAAEVGYLGMLGTHPKFQRHVDAQEAKVARQSKNEDVEKAMRGIVRALPRDLLRKFETLRDRCQQLRQIAMDLKQPGQFEEPMPLENIQLEGLDRLLWIYLKLLFTSYSLQRFLETTDEKEIQSEIRRVEQQVETLNRSADASRREKLMRTLEDNLATCRLRLDNYRKAIDNYELVQLEINRLENKIHSLSELAVNRQEPDYISGQVDQVAASMLDTERTINELQFVTGLKDDNDQVPDLLEPARVRTR